MFPRRLLIRPVSLALAGAVALGGARADDVEKKWRVSLALGGYDAKDEIESASANTMATLNPCIRTLTCVPEDQLTPRVFQDPRNDSQAFGRLSVQSGVMGTLAVQYGLSKIFMVEGSVGYYVADIGDVEVSVELPGNPSDNPEIFKHNFIAERIPVGQLERVPFQLGAVARLRPRATFNPYIGAGIGYSIIGFETDPAFDELSRNMDASRGVQMRLTSSFSAQGGQLLTDGMPQIDLEGATIDARDSFEWYLEGGAELTLKKNWSMFLDVRWVDASRSLAVSFNGSDELGNSVPQYRPYDDSPLADARYGPNLVGSCTKDVSGNVDHNGEPVLCGGGGLIDFGYLQVVPQEDAPPSVDCEGSLNDIGSSFCVLEFVFEPDGVPDPGQYYAQGGSFSYDGFSAQIGVRFTFGR